VPTKPILAEYPYVPRLNCRVASRGTRTIVYGLSIYSSLYIIQKHFHNQYSWKRSYMKSPYLIRVCHVRDNRDTAGSRPTMLNHVDCLMLMKTRSILRELIRTVDTLVNIDWLEDEFNREWARTKFPATRPPPLNSPSRKAKQKSIEEKSLRILELYKEVAQTESTVIVQDHAERSSRSCI
jgi:hypothetical protein